MKCGYNFKTSIGFNEFADGTIKSLIANGTLVATAPTIRRRCSASGLYTYYIYINPTQTQGSGFYQLYSSTSQSVGAGGMHTFFYFTGLDLSKYKKVVLKTSNVTLNPSGTYPTNLTVGTTQTWIEEGAIGTIPSMTPNIYMNASTGLTTLEFDISAINSGYLVFNLQPNYSAPVSINIVDLYLV